MLNDIDISKMSTLQKEALARKVEFLHKNLIEGKTISECSREMGVTRTTLYSYRDSDDYRKAAIELVDNSAIKGLHGVMNRLVKKLDANKFVVISDKDGNETAKPVADEKTRLEAVKELCKIYGVYAPTKTDAQVTVSVQSDSDLFNQIDELERDRSVVADYEEGPNGFELVKRQSKDNRRAFETRQRTVLHDAAVPEPE